MTYDQDVFRYTRDGGFCFEDPATRYMKKGELEARFAQMERQFNFVVAQAKEAIAR